MLASPLVKRDREDAVFADGFVESGDQVLLGDGALGKVLFHEFIFAFGHQLHQRFVRGLGGFLQWRGNFSDLALPIAAGE